MKYVWKLGEIFIKGPTLHESYWEEHLHIARVESSCSPFIEYSYGFNSDETLFHVTEKRGPERRYIGIRYYPKKSSKNHASEISVERVKALLAPVGHNSEPITTHRFVYHKKHKGAGSTDVFDAYSHRTQFFYDKYHRSTETALYSGKKNYKLYSKELYKWGREDQEGNLIGKILLDNNEAVHHARYFSYDQSGNAISKKLYGCLTGLPCKPLILKKSLSLVPDDYECEVKKYTYSGDGRNLLTSETDSNGVEILYEYSSTTDHLIAKRVTYENRIRSREFYAYDHNGALCKKVVDDSCGWLENDLNGVTQKLTTYIANRDHAPVGYPEKIVRTYFDFATGKEELLSVQILHYSPQGHLIRQENYDANNELGPVLIWEYSGLNLIFYIYFCI